MSKRGRREVYRKRVREREGKRERDGELKIEKNRKRDIHTIWIGKHQRAIQ